MEKALCRRGKKAFHRKNHNGGGDDNACDGMEGNRIKVFQQEVHCFGKANQGEQGTDTAGKQNRKIHMSDTVHKGSVQSQRHQQRGKTHAGGDNTQCQTKTAEKIPNEVWLNGKLCSLQETKQKKYSGHGQKEREAGISISAFFCGLPQQ